MTDAISDAFNRRLLAEITTAVPLQPCPFAVLAADLSGDEQTVISRIESLRSAGVIREISGIFDASALGYQQALVAYAVADGDLDRAGEQAAAHGGVSHCYARQAPRGAAAYNLWLALAVSPNSSLGLANTATELARRFGAQRHMVLPTIKRYKLDVRKIGTVTYFGGRAGDSPAVAAGSRPAAARQTASAGALPDEQVRAIRALQIDLPAQGDAFAPLADEARMSVEELLCLARSFIEAGYMRRYAAVLHHRAVGAAVNVLAAWQVGPAGADAAGAIAAELADVSHCYLRPAGPDWPYTLYTMIHGRTRQDAAMTIDEIATRTGLSLHVDLWTEREYAKRRVRLFSGDERVWEERLEGKG